MGLLTAPSFGKDVLVATVGDWLWEGILGTVWSTRFLSNFFRSQGLADLKAIKGHLNGRLNSHEHAYIFHCLFPL